MRNLKRVLSLALALVMVLGMMVITTSAADFTDADEITQIEAVEVLAALGIVEGSNGKFNPNGTFTREAAAKLLTYMLIGGDMAEKLAGTSVFTDVAANRWSAKYIAYCANLGYIGGVGNGKFNPSGVLTDIELGKLVLCALGYDASKYTGANWATAVTVDLLDAELVDSVTGTAISREDACAMILAGMKKGTDVTTYEVEFEGKPVFFDTKEDALLYAALGDEKATYKGENKATIDSLLKDVYDVTCATGTDDFGRPSTVYTDGDELNLAYAKTPVATYAGSDWKASVLKGALKAYDFDGADTIYNSINNTTGTWWGDGEPENYANFYNCPGITVEVYANADKEITDVVITEAYVAEITDVVTNDDDEIEEVEITVYEAGAVINETDNVITVDVKDDEDAYALIEAYAKDDLFMAYFVPGFLNEDVDVDDKLLAVDDIEETVEGEATSTTANAENYYEGWVKVDGEKYTFANQYTQADVEVKDEGTFYLYNDCIVHFVAEKEAEAQYLYVVRVGKELADEWNEEGSGLYNVEVVYTDGTCEVITVSSDTGVTSGVYTYEYNSKKEAYELDNGVTTSAEVDIETGKLAVTADDKANGKTVYVVVTTDNKKFDEADVYTGYRNVPSMSGDGYIVTANNFVKVVYIVDGKADADTSTDAIYIANASVSKKISDKDLGDYYTYTAVVGGEIVEIMVDAGMTNADKLNGVYNVTEVDEDGIYTKISYTYDDKYTNKSEDVDVKAAKDGVITIDGVALAYAEDVAVYVDDDGDIANGSINRNYSDNANVRYFVNKDGEVTMIFITK